MDTETRIMFIHSTSNKFHVIFVRIFHRWNYILILGHLWSLALINVSVLSTKIQNSVNHSVYSWHVDVTTKSVKHSFWLFFSFFLTTHSFRVLQGFQLSRSSNLTSRQNRSNLGECGCTRLFEPAACWILFERLLESTTYFSLLPSTFHPLLLLRTISARILIRFLARSSGIEL